MDNMFKNNDFLKGASEQEFVDKAIASIAEVAEKLSGLGDLIVKLMISAIRIGVCADGVISETERQFIRKFFCTLSPDNSSDDDVNEFISAVEGTVDDSMYRIVETVFNLNKYAGFSFINFILCFAYIDGVFEDEPAQHLTEIINKQNTNIFFGTPEDFLNSIDGD